MNIHGFARLFLCLSSFSMAVFDALNSYFQLLREFLASYLATVV